MLSVMHEGDYTKAQDFRELQVVTAFEQLC